MCRNGTMLEWTQSREKGFCKMKKKNMLFVCGTALALALGSPQMMGDVLAKPMPDLRQGDVVGEDGFVITEKMVIPYDGKPLAYIAFLPQEISVVEKDNKKIIQFYGYTLEGKKLKTDYGWLCSIDLINNLYMDNTKNYGWKPINPVSSFVVAPDEEDSSITVSYIIEYIKNNRPEIYNDVMEYGRKAEENAAAQELERLKANLDTAFQYAENEVSLFAQYGKQIDWAEFTQDSVDYAKSPALSDLIGHVFQLTDTYGFQTQRGDNGTPVIKTDRRKSALVHFTILQNSNGTYQIALMDDTGDFVGRDNVNRMPLMTDFRAYHEEFGYYTGLNDVFHKTGSFHSMGEVIGFPNLSNGLVSDGFVKVGLEKTDEVGKYRLVYYVTKESYDSYGGRSKASTKHDGYYATLTLVK